MKKEEKKWNSATINQFELSKMVYTSGFLANANLTPTAKLVLIALIQHYNANNAEMFPSQKFLSLQLGISEKSVERAIANLRDENFIFYTTQKVNKYRFTAHFFEQIKMSEHHRQNVGCAHRQNVGQTNNTEQINKKENFNFLTGGASGFATQTLENKEVSRNKVQFCKDANASKIMENCFKNQDLQEIFSNKNLKHVDFKKSCENFENDFRIAQSVEQQAFCELKEFVEKQKANDFGKSNEAQQEETSVLDWSREDALAWVLKLSPRFRVRGLAKQLTEKFDYSPEELNLVSQNSCATSVFAG